MEFERELKVGDLVRCISANGLLGIIVHRIVTPGWNQGDCTVLCFGSTQSWPFQQKQLELVSASR